MLIASEPFNLMRAAQMACARVEMKYGRSVFETGQWWWEIEERARPEYEWMVEEITLRTTGERCCERPFPTDATTLLGIAVRFVPTAKILERKSDERPSLGRLSLHTDRTDLPCDSRLYR